MDLSSLPAGSVVSINISGHIFNITIDEEVLKKSNLPESEKDKKSSKDGENPTATGNGTGTGSGFSNGSGSGEGNFTGSGVSVGDLSGQSNQGTGDSGQNGGGSASEGKAYEILKENNTPPTAKNSQLLAVFGVALVILIIALGYRSKSKDDYQLDNHNYEL